MTDTRQTITSYLDDHPGVHFNQLVRSLELASGQVQHHVYRLLREGRIEREELHGRTHYYSLAYDAWERTALAMLRRETARYVVVELLHEDGRRPGELADRLDIARSTLEWHVGHLVEHDVVTKRRDDAGRVTLHLVRPSETSDLLLAVTPDCSEKFVDRFQVLVDGLLDNS